MTGHAKQNVVWKYSYDAFGKGTIDPGEADSYRFVGSGDVFSDDDVDLQYMWNRWYDPQLGQFISRDHLSGVSGSSESQNKYVYVEDDPVNKTDPTGHGSGDQWSSAWFFWRLGSGFNGPLPDLPNDIGQRQIIGLMFAEARFSKYSYGDIEEEFGIGAVVLNRKYYGDTWPNPNKQNDNRKAFGGPSIWDIITYSGQFGTYLNRQPGDLWSTVMNGNDLYPKSTLETKLSNTAYRSRFQDCVEAMKVLAGISPPVPLYNSPGQDAPVGFRPDSSFGGRLEEFYKVNGTHFARFKKGMEYQ